MKARTAPQETEACGMPSSFLASAACFFIISSSCWERFLSIISISRTFWNQVSSIASMEHTHTELRCLILRCIYVLTSISSGGMCCILSSDLIILHVLIAVLFDINSHQVTVLADLTYASKDIPFFHDQFSLRSRIFTQVWLKKNYHLYLSFIHYSNTWIC